MGGPTVDAERDVDHVRWPERQRVRAQGMLTEPDRAVLDQKHAAFEQADREFRVVWDEIRRSGELSPRQSMEEAAMLKAFDDAVAGRTVLSEEVIALFDLIHDPMLTSWHDHALAHTLYLQTRGIDRFGDTEFVAEAAAQAKLEPYSQNAQRLRTPPAKAPPLLRGSDQQYP